MGKLMPYYPAPRLDFQTQQPHRVIGEVILLSNLSQDHDVHSWMFI